MEPENEYLEGEEQVVPETPGPETFLEGDEPEIVEETAEQKSAAYFQSRYDKAQAELNELKGQQAQIIQYLQQQAQQQQQLQPSGGQPQVNPYAAGRESGESLQKPVRPQMPQGYDPIDATTDPESPSWKYREGLDQYFENMALYTEQVQQNAVRQAEAMAAQQVYQQRVRGVRHELSNTYGMSEDEISDFFRVMDDPSVITMENLVRLYRVSSGKEPANSPRRPARMTLPPPPTGKVGAPRQEGRPEDRIMDDMIRQFNGLNIND